MTRLLLIHLALLLAPVAYAQPAGASDPVTERIERLLRTTPLIDGHSDLMLHYYYPNRGCADQCPRPIEAYDISERTPGHTDIPRWRKGGIGAQLLNSGAFEAGPPTLEGTLGGFAFVGDLVARHSDSLVLARTSADIRRAHAGGRIAILLALENPGRLGADEAGVLRLAEAGLRANILAYSGPTAYADGHAGPAQHGGLSELGRQMVGWMQRHGVLVDLSHASADTMRDVLDIASAPVIFSHSNAAGVAPMSRNVPDDILRRLAANGGIVMVTFAPYFASRDFSDWMDRGDAQFAEYRAAADGDVERASQAMDTWIDENPPPPAGIAHVADHIEHIRNVAGIDHVGIGADFDGIPVTVDGLEDVAAYPRLFAELARRGWSDEEMAKLAGENFLRVLDAADKAATDACCVPED